MSQQALSNKIEDVKLVMINFRVDICIVRWVVGTIDTKTCIVWRQVETTLHL